MKRVKKIFIIILSIVIFILLVMYHKGYFLPKAQIGIKYTHWNNRDYYLKENENWFYEPNKWVAKNDEGYYLFSLKGDIKKNYYTLYPSIIDGYHRHPVFIESGFRIPTSGTVTGIIITEGGPSVWGTKFVQQKKVINLLQVFLNESDINQCRQEKDVINADFYKIYFCFENCPVSGKFAGYIAETEKDYMVIMGEKGILSDGSGGHVKISKGANCVVVKDIETKKEIKKIIGILRYYIES